MEPGNLIQTERIKRGWSQAELGKRVGISQVAVKKIEAGETRRSKYFPKISEVLGIPLAKLDTSLSSGPIADVVNHPSMQSRGSILTELQPIPPERLMGTSDLDVYGTVNGGQGVLVLSSEPFSQVPRPQNLFNIQGAYGVLITGHSMAKEYREGDIAYVNPHLHPRVGDACVFQSHKPDGTVEAMIKYLTKAPEASSTLWHVEQSNPQKKFTLKKSEWQICHVAVGKQSGR
ncbi:helix-turn-helix domain-containing protein [Bradyrhizobium sp. 179]|uniref:helix-turn-helix domain-containing protein n=1 Tax=Bradyrhizobium sp. 179 TaxID=2782648 RepID=UPI001FF7C06A|nr:helix-turn-helix domain-containing protein [Bradyrhizobium sp. 179]MCK1541417.1 helix-turn-helix domain-containing protein [Bradyrhizobium sp. 179]